MRAQHRLAAEHHFRLVADLRARAEREPLRLHWLAVRHERRWVPLALKALEQRRHRRRKRRFINRDGGRL